ncbi:MAG: ParA family protein [Chitinispirillaceae bacterium]|nr:ParA family protein [Chitinispirillaceae bacterium]
MKIVSVLNHKGGVGKTTFTASCAQALSLVGFRVCVIDNDSQHNLSTLMGVGVKSPSIRDVYKSDEESAQAVFLQSIRKTEITNLHIITSNNELSDLDIKEVGFLKKIIDKCKIERFYDFVIIDNAPGLGLLQGATIVASEEIFVPTELRQFAIDGLVEMDEIINRRYPEGAKITKIIPNFFRNTKRQHTFISALRKLFGNKVTETVIPFDNVFDELVTEGKILFLHRLYSSGAAYYLKLIHELFNLDEEDIWEKVLEKRRERISIEARKRFFSQREEKEK